MNISSRYGQTPVRFRELPQRKQYKVMDQLIEQATDGVDPKGTMSKLSDSLGLRSRNHLNVALIDAGDGLDAQDAGDGVQELAEALRFPENKVDLALGAYVESLAQDTRPSRPGHGGAVT